MRWFFFYATFIAVLPAPIHAETDPKPLETWLRKQSTIRSLEADFTQERRLPSLKKPVIAKGRLSMRRPGWFRWELGNPPKTIALADGSTLVLADAVKKRARRIPLDSPEARRFTLLASEAFASSDTFHKTFELHETRTTNGIYQATLRLLDRRMRSKIPWIFLTIDSRSSRLLAIEIELSDQSRILNRFTKVRINPKLPDSRFHLDLSGYRVR